MFKMRIDADGFISYSSTFGYDPDSVSVVCAYKINVITVCRIPNTIMARFTIVVLLLAFTVSVTSYYLNVDMFCRIVAFNSVGIHQMHSAA